MTTSGDEVPSAARVVFDDSSYSIERASEIDARDSEIAAVLNSRIFEPAVFELLNTYYFQLRASLTSIGDGPDLPKRFAEARRQILQVAARLTLQHLRSGIPEKPAWIEGTRRAVVEASKAEFADASRISIRLDQIPRLQCRALPSGEVCISAFTRPFFSHLSLCVYSLIDSLSDETWQEEFQEAETALIRMTLPYFIFMNDVVPVSRLPQMGAPDLGVFESAQIATEIQMRFLLAHEFGHLLEGHPLSRPQDRASALEREYVADAFAYRMTMGSLSDELVVVAYPSLRWIFHLQQLDEVVGCLLRGRVPEVESLAFDQRKNRLYSVLTKVRPVPRVAWKKENAGTALLMSMKHRILGLGCDKLRAIADELSRDLNVATAQPWWEAL